MDIATISGKKKRRRREPSPHRFGASRKVCRNAGGQHLTARDESLLYHTNLFGLPELTAQERGDSLTYTPHHFILLRDDAQEGALHEKAVSHYEHFPRFLKL